MAQRRTAQGSEISRVQDQEIPPGNNSIWERSVSKCQDLGITTTMDQQLLCISNSPPFQILKPLNTHCEDPLLQAIKKDAILNGSNLYPSCRCCSVARSCPTLCDPMECTTPGSPVLHCLPEIPQIHGHRSRSLLHEKLCLVMKRGSKYDQVSLDFELGAIAGLGPCVLNTWMRVPMVFG